MPVGEPDHRKPVLGPLRGVLLQIPVKRASGACYYGIEASQASYIFAMSALVSVTTIGLPNAPISVVATANSSSKITVTWTETVLPGELPIASYQIYRGTSPDNLVQVAQRTTASYIDNTRCGRSGRWWMLH